MSRAYKTKKKGTGLSVSAFVVMLLFAMVAFSMGDLKKQSKAAQICVAKLESRIKSEKERKVEIKNKEAYMQTKKYIEDTARGKLGLVYEDEIILKARP